MKKGIFISIEGNDCSGKSTQIGFIKEYLENKGIKAIFTREPGGTKIGEDIRNILLDSSNKEMTALTEAFLYASSRAQHVEEKILPALRDGKNIICDRYVDSSFAYQEFARGLGEKVRTINEIATSGLMPDYTFFLHLDQNLCKDRMKKREIEEDRIENENSDFSRRVYEGYLKVYDRYKDRIIFIDASKSIEEVRYDIERHLDRIFKDELEL